MVTVRVCCRGRRGSSQGQQSGPAAGTTAGVNVPVTPAGKPASDECDIAFESAIADTVISETAMLPGASERIDGVAVSVTPRVALCPHRNAPPDTHSPGFRSAW